MKKFLFTFSFVWMFFGYFALPAFGLTERELIAGLSQLQNLPAQTPEGLRLTGTLQKALSAYQSITDYKTSFYKTEKSNGSLGPPERIYLKFEKSFKIYMRWLNTEKRGVEVVYERGKNKGKLALHKPGLLFGLTPVIFLDQNSPWIKAGSASYNIEDAGIGSFLFDFTDEVIRAFREGKLKVAYHGKIVGEEINGETVEVTFLNTKAESGYLAYRVWILFDEKTSLPIHMELFDWQNQPMGIYTYKDLKINIGPDDLEFKNQINHFLLRIFYSKND
ncbi:MAG: hypothetical protein AUJ71_01290 [Candidatus Omnitrophica bacterium CG1_02_49_16]|nr:MAG: hypothetical protein AUJ71_01290 [Candidatus Omnitrophica bacterium CG1_02_49_16]